MPTTRTKNANARQYVQDREPFTGNNLFARLISPNESCPTYRYVVFSYGLHWPLFIAEWLPEDGVVHWYENTDRRSVTTAKHRSQAHPHVHAQAITGMDTSRMQIIVERGMAGLAMTPPEHVELGDIPF